MNDFDLTHSNGIHIPHLSPSTVSSWVENKYGFYNSKILRKPFKGNDSMSRGKAIEFAINEWMAGTIPVNMIVQIAESKFVEECKLAEVDPMKILEMKPSIEGLATKAYSVYMNILPMGFLSQLKIQCRLPGVKRDIVGYMDYHKPSVITRDCKVVNRTPSKLKQSYVMQGSVYRYATTVNTAFDFFVANKTPVYKELILTDEEYEHGISYYTQACKALEELEECDNPKRVLQLQSFPNLEAMYNDEEKLQACEEWGIVPPPLKGE